MKKETLLAKLPYIIFLISLIATLVSCWFAVGNVRQYSQHKQEIASLQLTNLIHDQLVNVENLLQGSSGLFIASEQVTREEWFKWVQNLKAHERISGLQGVGFSKSFNADQLSQIESEVRSDGYPNFKVFPDIAREEYTSIIYLEPLDKKNLRAFGYDMFTEPNRRVAMEYTRDTGSVSLSDKVTLLQEEELDKQPGFLSYLAIYKSGIIPETIEQRKQQLLGYVYTPIRAVDFIGNINNRKPIDLDFQVFDGSGSESLTENHLIYSSSPELLKPGYVAWYSSLREIEFGGNTWTLRFATNSNFGLSSLEKNTPILILIIGILFSILLMFLVRRSLINAGLIAQKWHFGSNFFLQQSIEEDALIDADERVIITTDQQGIISVFNAQAEKKLGYLEAEVKNQLALIDLVDPALLKDISVMERQKTGLQTMPDFDVLITNCLIEGEDYKDLELITAQGQNISLRMEIKPLYNSQQLLGYQFISQQK